MTIEDINKEELLKQKVVCNALEKKDDKEQASVLEDIRDEYLEKCKTENVKSDKQYLDVMEEEIRLLIQGKSLLDSIK